MLFLASYPQYPVFLFFQVKKKYLKSVYLFVLQPFWNSFHQEATNISVHFQKKFIEKFQAGESGIVLKPLNARLSTCILKNEQKNEQKKEKK